MTRTQHVGATRSRLDRVARLITELLAPVVLIVALLLVVAIRATGSVGRGLVLGLVAAAFAGGVPYAILLAGVRSGRLTDRHLKLREQRPRMMVIGLASVVLGLTAMTILDAPRLLFALVAAMAAGVAVALAVSSFWKISIHTACAAGSVAVLAVTFGPQALALTPVVAAVAWARVRLRDHTVPQVAAGAAVGCLVAACVMAPLAG